MDNLVPETILSLWPNAHVKEDEHLARWNEMWPLCEGLERIAVPLVLDGLAGEVNILLEADGPTASYEEGRLVKIEIDKSLFSPLLGPKNQGTLRYKPGYHPDGTWLYETICWFVLCGYGRIDCRDVYSKLVLFRK